MKPMAGKWHITKGVAVLILALCLQARAQDRYLVRIHGDAVANFAQKHGLTLVTRSDSNTNRITGSISPLPGPVHDLYVATLASGPSSQAALQSIQNDPSVERVEPNQPVSLPRKTAASLSHWRAADGSASGNVSYFGTPAWGAYVTQPAAGIVRIQGAHQLATGAGTVAFLDTGVDFTNPVLGASLNFGWDFTTNTPGGSDIDPAQLNQSTTSILDDESVVILDQSTTSILDQSTTSILDQSTTSILDGQPATSAYGHGTMIAGIIHLVAPTARLLPVKVFGSDGTSDLATILSGFYWAVNNGAKVINMSFSMSDYSAEFSRALDYAASKAVISVASAGNDGSQVIVYPAGYSQAMGVASTDNYDQRSSFSNYGSVVTVAAPGEGVISTYPGALYAAGWGTSFSAPFVSGAAALLVDIDGHIGQSQAQLAVSQAMPVGQGLGAGRLDLVQACLFEAARGGN
jgi:thermitase